MTEVSAPRRYGHHEPDTARWVCAGAWLVLALLAPWHTAADRRTSAVAAVIIGWGWVGWTVVATALLVRTPVSLSVTRWIAPLSLVVSAAARSPWSTSTTLVALGASWAPSFADHMVQGGAYGRETRFALRTPVPQMAPAVVAWLIVVTTLISGSLLTAAESYIAGVPLLIVGAVLCTRTPRHLHRLSRRWLVVVPAGVVVHDHVVLAETFMVRSVAMSSVEVVDAAGDAADLTGGVTGRHVRIAMRDADKVVLSPITARTMGTTEALHVLSFTVAPRRPADLMAALGR